MYLDCYPLSSSLQPAKRIQLPSKEDLLVQQIQRMLQRVDQISAQLEASIQNAQQNEDFFDTPEIEESELNDLP